MTSCPFPHLGEGLSLLLSQSHPNWEKVQATAPHEKEGNSGAVMLSVTTLKSASEYQIGVRIKREKENSQEAPFRRILKERGKADAFPLY
jgi:hypothetical protein